MGNSRVFHDIDPNEFLSRMTPFKLYYLIRGKITFEFDLDSGFNKILFSIFLPVYMINYLYVALRTNNKYLGILAVIFGIKDGIFKEYINRY